MTYDLNKIHALLLDGFSEEELRGLCFYEPEFRPLQAQLPQKASKAEIIDRLLNYAEQKLLMETLLAWASKNNPARYKDLQPYHKISVPISPLANDVRRNPPNVQSIQSNMGDTQVMTGLAPQTPTLPVDFVIITPLEEERKAILNKFPDAKKLPPIDEDINVYYETNLPIDSGNGSYRIIVMPLLGIGRVQATTATNDAIRRWCPRYVILVGIAGGVQANNVRLGDVIIPDKIVDYELQEQTVERIDIRWEVYNVSPRLLGQAKNFTDESWTNLITVKRPQRGQLQRHIGPIASGDKVVDYAQALEKYQEAWSKLIGVEMEAGGVAVAAFQAAKQTEFFMIRGVSDLADGEKNTPPVKKWRAYACEVAAAYTITWLKSGPVTLSAASEDQLVNRQQTHDKSREKHRPNDPVPITQVTSGHHEKPERAGQERNEGEYHILWQTETGLKPKHFFASPDYLCLADNKAFHFFSTHDSKPLFPSLTTFKNFSLAEYDINGGAIAPSGHLLLTLLPRSWTRKACLLALKFEQRKKQLSVEWVYEAPDAQLSTPIIDYKVIYLIQLGTQLAVLNPEDGQVLRTFSLPPQYDLHQNCVSLVLAAGYFCLALCDGTILGLDPKTGQTVTKLYQEPNQLPLSSLVTDGWRLFFGTSDRVCALDLVSKQEEWSFELPAELAAQDRLIKGQLLVFNNVVCVAGGNYLYALDCDTGQELWHHQMPDRIKLGPKWIHDSIVVVDRKGNIHALQFSAPKFVMTYHYDLRTPPTLNKWNPVVFTLVNTGYRIAYNTTLRLPSDEFKGVSEHHTQEPFTIAPGELRNCKVNFKPITGGSTVHLPITIEYEDDTGRVGKHESDLFIIVRDSKADPISDKERGLLPDGTLQYNFTALQALLIATLSEGHLNKLCRTHFRVIYNLYWHNLNQIEKIEKLIEYIVRQRQVEQLLTILQQHNPTRYDQYIQDIRLAVRSLNVSPPPTSPLEFDVFLAHHSQDKPHVETIAEKLRQRGLRPWLDKEQIPPGRWFQDIIQQAIKNVKSAAIFIGPHGLGKWQIVELRAFISECVGSGLPVIPILLPGTDRIPEDLLFLKELNWVRFAGGIEDAEALDNLEWGITGKHPRLSPRND